MALGVDLGSGPRTGFPEGTSYWYAQLVAKETHGLYWLPEMNRLMQWDGSVWAPQPGLRSLQEAIRNVYGKADMACMSKQSRANLMRCINTTSTLEAACKNELSITLDRFNTDPHLLNFENGILNLREWVFHHRNATDTSHFMLTQRMKFPFPEADYDIAMMDYDAISWADLCPKWIDLLHHLVGMNADVRDLPKLSQHYSYLWDALGYGLIGENTQQVWFLLVGPGQNGKSTLLQTVNQLMGSYSAPAPESLIAENRYESGKASPEVAALWDKRFVIIPEIALGTKLNSARLKNLTGGEEVYARRLYADGVRFVPKFKLWMASNGMPEVSDLSDGFWRRCQLLNTAEKIEESKRNYSIMDDLMDEGGWIQAWLAHAAREYLVRGKLRRSDNVKAFTAAARRESDLLGQFLTTYCESASGFVKTSDFRLKFSQFLVTNGHHPRSSQWIRQQMAARGYQLAPLGIRGVRPTWPMEATPQGGLNESV